MGMSGPDRTGFRELIERPPEIGVKWVIGPQARADILGYAGVDITGAQFISQIYASGFRRGTLEGDRLKSIVIGAPYGTRIILCTTTDEASWEDAPWRAIRVLEGQTYHTTEGVPAVRVPDIEWLDGFDHRRTGQDGQQSYPLVRRVSEGRTWTFGYGSGLHNRIKMIRVEKESMPIDSSSVSSLPNEEIGERAPPPVVPSGPPPSIASVSTPDAPELDQWRLPTKK